MIIIQKQLTQEDLSCPLDLIPEHSLFFDIETTGLSHRASHLYMIGALFRETEEIQLIQWFLQKPSEEKEVLLLFTEYLKKVSSLIHYNGQSFDIPYLKDRCKYWDLDDLFSDNFFSDESPENGPFSNLDLYRELRPLKQFLGLSSMKQKDVEDFLEFPRKDQMSGQELIQVYQHYLQDLNETDLNLLLLHNHDDLLGMLSVYHLASYLDSLKRKQFSAEAKLQENQLILQLETAASSPVPLEKETEEADLSLQEQNLILTIHGIRGTFLHYYTNYKDYYYLPLEDTAIHKSVAVYVDPSCRKKAKADNCYTKKEGLFFFQPSPLFLPEFRKDTRKGPSFFSSEQPEKNPELIPELAAALLSHLMHAN